MAKVKRRDVHVYMQCTECKERNYTTHFVARGGKKLALKKYCPRCRRHTAHRSRRID